VIEDLDVEIHVVRAGFVGESSDGTRAEASTGSIRGRQIERCADDRHIGSPGVEMLGIGEEWSLTERRQSSEDVPEVELLT
jgi:hypothetical protein